MEITTISRKISGMNYDNISATATIDKDEDVAKAAKNLDAILKKALSEIEQQNEVFDSSELPFQKLAEALKQDERHP